VTNPATDLKKSGSGSDLDPKRWLALGVIGLAQLMVVLDATIVNVSLPTAGRALHIPQPSWQWMITAYALPFGSLLLLGGRIADFLGRKRVLMVSLAGFAAASALGGAAQNELMLFSARGLQGVFAALLAPAALSLLTVTFRDPNERAKAFGVFGAIAGGGAAVGLVLGGILTEYASWRWCLFVNIPISLIGIAAGSRLLTESKASSTGNYDVPGALMATIGLGSLVWGFTQAASTSWGVPGTYLWLVLGVVLLVAFVLFEQRTAHPLLPMRILLDRNRAGAYLVGLFVGVGLFAMFLFLTYFLQIVKGYTPIKTGLAFLPFSAGVIVGAGVGSQLVLKLGAKIMVPLGLAMSALGLFWLTGLAIDSTYSGRILPAIIVMSIGMGFIFMSTTNVALVGVSRDDSGVASAMVNTTQQIGGSLGTALLTTFFASAAAVWATARHSADVYGAAAGAAGINTPDGVAALLQSQSKPGEPAPVTAAKLLFRQSQIHGYVTAFWWGAGFFVLALVISLILINAGKQTATVGDPVLAS